MWARGRVLSSCDKWNTGRFFHGSRGSWFFSFLFSFSCLSDTNSGLLDIRAATLRKCNQSGNSISCLHFSPRFSPGGRIHRLNITSLVCINGRRLERQLTSSLRIIFYSRVTITGAVTCRKHEGRNSQHARWFALARDAIKAGLHTYIPLSSE